MIPKDFDWKFYLEYYKDLRLAGIKTERDAKFHYLNDGQREGRIYNERLNKIKIFNEICSQKLLKIIILLCLF